MKRILWISNLFLISYLSTTLAQCPWHREVPELQSSCLCSYNLGRELSVQCDMVAWPKLLSALNNHATLTPIDLLYVNNSTLGALEDNIFVNLEIHNIQLSGCKINVISDNALQGQELFLKNLNLQDNDLSVIPVEALKNLRTLQLLDLSHNRISFVSEGAFETLNKLSTLKLSDNNVTLASGALRGLEKSLKNLNLKGTAQKRVPQAIQGMKTLAFLDLSQNSIRELPGPDMNKTFEGLESLTALNLERNILQNLDDNAFYGIRKTLSSLSLLNNLLADFPTAAMSVLSELRVLDIGFNLLTELPHNAFRGNPSITLLALDGNPLTTIPFEAFSHLNGSLRGLSLGGRFLHCDCRLSWVINWIRNKDLQVTSRERNPQFCGSPPRFRDRGFYSIQPEELQCKSKPTVSKPVNEPVGVATVVSADLEDLIVPQQFLTSSTSTTELSTTNKATTTSTKPSSTSTTTRITTTTSSTSSSTSTTAVTKAKTKSTPSWKNTRPPIVMTAFPIRNKADESKEVMVKTAYRQDNSVIIQWDSQVVNILGFRVVYRLFGDKSFKQGPPLEASEREFKIKNVPSQECIIVCVVSLEDLNITPETVPFAQCREVRTVSPASSNMDKITIVASAAICGTIVVAVIVFIAATRRRSKKLHEFHQQKMSLKHRVPVPGLPVNCCNGMAASPGEGMPSLVTLNAFSSGKDWDQVSAYSTQRPRMYPVEQPQSFDDLRSNFSSKGGGAKTRSVADGQSQNSFSNHSGRYLANDFQNNLLAVAARQDLRASRQSLAMLSERISTRVPPSHHGTTNQSVHSSTRGSRPRSRTRDGHHHRRPSSRYSTADSTHSLNQYCENSDNWTDHDMDIYMTRGHAAKNSGLVPL